MSSQMKVDESMVAKDVIIPQSFKGMTVEEARVFLRSIMDLFQLLAHMNDLKTMYEAGKQLSRLYFDCANHQRELAEILLELEFPEYAIKTMKKLNNMGVFKNDDIWFSSFYFYNICWNYSDASFEFATALGVCGLPNLLSLNIGHRPYLDNLSSRNVYYLIKASLSIIHNICRYPGSCTHFRIETVRSSLLNLVQREEDFIRVVASLCLTSVVGENESHLLAGGGAPTSEERPDVLLNVVNYVRKARASERNRFMGFRSHELLQGVRAATAVEMERTHFVDLGGLDLLLEALSSRTAVAEEDLAECLEILCNLSLSRDLQARVLASGLTGALVAVHADSESMRVRTAARDFLWSLEAGGPAAEGELAVDGAGGPPWPVYLCHAASNRALVERVRDRLTESGLVRVLDPVDRADTDSVKAAIAGSVVVLVALSEALKSHPRHQLEVEHAERLGRPVLALLVHQKYRCDGWLQRLLDRGTALFDLSSKRDFESSWQALTDTLRRRLDDIQAGYEQRRTESRVKREQQVYVEERQKAERSNCLDDLSRSQHLAEPLPTQLDGGVRRCNGPDNVVVEEARTRTVDVVSQCGMGETVDVGGGAGGALVWLQRHGLGHLGAQLALFDMDLLTYYRDVKTRAPEFFYQTLEKRLQLDLVDILKFSNAIDDL